jgi:hypothetical protein
MHVHTQHVPHGFNGVLQPAAATYTPSCGLLVPALPADPAAPHAAAPPPFWTMPVQSLDGSGYIAKKFEKRVDAVIK